MPFIKGDSRINRNGRPEGSGLSITTEIRRKLMEVPDGQKKSYLLLLIDRIIKAAIVDGDTKMIDKVWAYVDGMPKQSMDLGLEDDVSEIEITVRKNEDKS